MKQSEQKRSEMARISRLRDNTLGENYEPHDISSALLIERLDEIGYYVESHGDDKRDSEQVYSGTGVDYEVRSPHSSKTCGWFEVKSKRNAEWMGRLNQSHYEEYAGFAAYADEPVFLVFALVDDSDFDSTSESFEDSRSESEKVDEQCVEDWQFAEVPSFGSKNIVEELPFSSKGHDLYEIDDEYLHSWPWVMARLFPP